MPDPKLIVLDLAGTTIEDRGGIAEAFRIAFKPYGIAVSNEQLSAVRGRAKRVAVAELLAQSGQPQELADSIILGLQHAVQDVVRQGGITPIEGARRTCEALRERGIRVALNTGFDRDTTSYIIETLRWQDAVNAIVCADDVAEGRPAPFMIFRAMEATRTQSVTSVAVAGDTTADLRAAANAGVRWNIGVLTGAHTREQLETAPHTDIVESILDLGRPEYFSD